MELRVGYEMQYVFGQPTPTILMLNIHVLGGRWHTFDPRNNAPRVGRVLIARGRDAADVAMITTFGPNTLESFRVWTDEITDRSL